MLHEPAPQESGEDTAAPYKTKLGVIMFFVYGIIYAGFVLINVFSPETMETIMPTGINLATAYGFGLIIFALVLALIYNALCSARENAGNADQTKKEG